MIDSLPLLSMFRPIIVPSHLLTLCHVPLHLLFGSRDTQLRYYVDHHRITYDLISLYDYMLC